MWLDGLKCGSQCVDFSFEENSEGSFEEVVGFDCATIC